MHSRKYGLARTLVAIALLALAAAPRARAAEVSEACTDDLARLCAGASPSRAGKLQCLSSHQDELSEGCRTALSEPMQRRLAAGEACGDDAQRLCADAQPGRNNTGITKCLLSHADSLSEECRTALDALTGKNREGAASGG